MEDLKSGKYKYEMLTIFNTELDIAKQLEEDKEYLMEESGHNLKFWKDLKQVLKEMKEARKKYIAVARATNTETGAKGLVIMSANEK